MKIHYFPEENDVGTTFTFEDDKGSDNQEEMKDFSQWLESMDLHFTKLKLRQPGGRASTCVVVEGLESDEEEEEESNQQSNMPNGLLEALFQMQGKPNMMSEMLPTEVVNSQTKEETVNNNVEVVEDEDEEEEGDDEEVVEEVKETPKEPEVVAEEVKTSEESKEKKKKKIKKKKPETES